jgi:hypothetical protein
MSTASMRCSLLGADGWELVTGQAAELGAHTYLFKRQIG